jgi:hypothetical protein
MHHKAKIRSGPLVIFTFLLGCTGQSATRPVQPIEPRRPAAAMFGRIDKDGRFLRLSELQLIDSRQFVWRIQLPCLGPVEYVETMTLPAPGDWKNIEEGRKADPRSLRETTISADGKTTVTHDYAACVDGWIEHGWTIAHDDPADDWTIRVDLAGYAPEIWRVRFRR